MSEVLIECKELCKRYGMTHAIDHVTLTLSAGEPIALIGPNGAGKTTLISLICGFIAKSAGELRVLGEKPGSKLLNGKLAALPQDALLAPAMSVGSQLRLFARLQGMTAKQAADDVERVLQMVDLLDALNKRPVDLSNGMRKRVSIAQALLGSPKLVILDEPTAGVDPPNVKIIRELIRRFSHQTTCIVSSHNLNEVEQLCGSVVHLENGRLRSVERLADESLHDFITLRLTSAPESDFLRAAEHVPGVLSVKRNADGDYILETDDSMQSSLALMQLQIQHGWTYKSMSRGKSLEERLYGSS